MRDIELAACTCGDAAVLRGRSEEKEIEVNTKTMTMTTGFAKRPGL